MNAPASPFDSQTTQSADPAVRLDQLVDTLPQLVWSTRPDGYCDFYNRGWLEYTGKAFAEQEGDGWQNALHPDDRERVATVWNEAVAGKGPYRVEYRLRRHDGVFRWHLAHGLPILDADGHIVRWYGSSTDIHDQKAEQERQRFLARIADNTRLLEDADEIMAVTVRMIRDFFGADRVTFAEIDAATGTATIRHEASVAGWSLQGHFRATDFGDEVAKELANGWVVAIDDAKTHPLSAPYFESIYSKLNIRAALSVPLLRNGELVAALSLSLCEPHSWATEEADLLLSVAGRTWLSVENARLHDELESHRRRMLDLLATVPGAVWEAWGDPHSPGQRIHYISPYVETMLGYSTDEWLATPNFWLQVVHPEDRARAVENARRHFEAGDVAVNEFRWVTRDGKSRWVAAYSAIVRDESGAPTGMRGVNLDITERKEAEQEVLLLNERLRRAMQETHHRVRNNLQLVVALLDRQPGDGPVLPEQLRDISAQVRALAAVHDLLTDQARLDGVAATVSARDFFLSLARLVKESSGVGRLLADVSDARLSAREATPLALIANELLTNAVKYGNGEIGLAFDVEGTTGILTVTDNGPGFAPGFEPPSATTGLGLVAHIASWELQAEPLRFDTLPQGGGRVTVSLPLSLASSAADAA